MRGKQNLASALGIQKVYSVPTFARSKTKKRLKRTEKPWNRSNPATQFKARAHSVANTPNFTVSPYLHSYSKKKKLLTLARNGFEVQ